MKKIFMFAFVMILSYKNILGQDDKLGNRKTTYFALLVGANNYEHYSDLLFPISDIRTLKNTLREYNFDEENIVSIENPTEEDFHEKIKHLKKKVRTSDNLLIYISLHGELINERHYYWLPCDATENLKKKIYVRDFLNDLDEIDCQQILLVVDSCFGGSIFDNIPNSKSTTSDNDIITTKMIESYLSKRGAIAITSGANKERVPDKSHFFQAFNRSLIINENIELPVDILFQRAKNAVNIEQAKKGFNGKEITPQISKINYLKNEGGMFVFKKKTGTIPSTKFVIGEDTRLLVNNNKVDVDFKLGKSIHREILAVNENEVIEVIATGQIKAGQVLGTVTPHGKTKLWVPFPIDEYKIVSEHPFGSLIYRLAPDKPWQFCGDGCEIKVPQTGVLSLEFHINDNDTKDNAGFFEINIKKQ